MAVADHIVDLPDRVTAEDQVRADVYRLLATLLSSSPSAAQLKSIAQLQPSIGAFGTAVTTLSRIAAAVNEAEIRSEFNTLFIGIGRGELVPYGSYYLTGFLQEKPLAQLRRDMARLGIGRSGETSDPEDHVASVCEIMAGLIAGRFGAPAALSAQRAFFEQHIGSWMPVFFKDLQAAKASVFYAAVGTVGTAFLDIEGGAFDMV